MQKFWVGVAGVAAAASMQTAMASDFGVYAKAGSSGYGAGLGYKLTDSLRVRAEYNAFNFDPGDDSATNIETDTVDYSTELNLRYGGLLLDWHPFHGVFRVTGGAILNDSELNVKAEDGFFYAGNGSYSARALDLRGKADFDSVAPYFGIGWGDVAGTKGHFSFVADIGVVFQGAPDVKLSANCAAAGVNANACRQRLANEERQIQDDADAFDFWPFLSVGVGYRF